MGVAVYAGIWCECAHVRAYAHIRMRRMRAISVPGYGNTRIKEELMCVSGTASWHQAITWTNIDLSSKFFCSIHLGAILSADENKKIIHISQVPIDLSTDWVQLNSITATS